MRGKILAYVPEEPCPVCGTPRVGIDGDDDYYIVPGRLLHCDCPGCSARTEALPPVFAKPGPDKCPKCGHSLRWEREKVWSYPDWVFYRASCAPYAPEAGCEECRKKYSYLG